MQRSLVMTVLAKDRPGLVESVSAAVAEHGGNWLESRMSRLGGQFAGIVRVQVPADKESALSRALQNLDVQGLKIVVYSDSAAAPARKSLCRLEIVGQDRPGIVRQITHALAEARVNVEEFSSECSSAAMSGETLFKATARLDIPAGCNQSELRRTLERIAADLIVEINLEPEQAP
ncbi:MAG: ACT domain-containing protein [Verrucomicrobiota bacterium]